MNAVLLLPRKEINQTRILSTFPETSSSYVYCSIEVYRDRIQLQIEKTRELSGCLLYSRLVKAFGSKSSHEYRRFSPPRSPSTLSPSPSRVSPAHLPSLTNAPWSGQLIFCAVVLGLSITLIKGQVFGSAPSQTDFSAFAGGWGMLAALVGILATTVLGMLEGIPMLVLDTLATLFLLAAGIVSSTTHSLSLSSCATLDLGWTERVLF